MNIFSRKQKEVVVLSANLKQQSANALDSFHRVMQELKSVNELSKTRQAELDAEATRINAEKKELEAINASNLKVIGNIEKILS